MKKGLGAGGYTLVEVMIVMAISGSLLLAAGAMISGQRNRTEFSQAIREIDSQIQDVINDVATGYYANTANFNCSAAGAPSRPRLTPTASGDSQGTNRDCVFIGRVMHFGVANSDRERFNVYNVVGLRQALSGGEYANVQTLAQARPTAMARGSADTTTPDSTEQKKLQYGLRIRSMTVNGQPVGAVGFLGSLVPGASNGGNLVSGAQTVNMLPIPGTTLDATSGTTVDRINALDTASITLNPSNGVVLCFESGGTNEYGQITIGSNARRLTTTTVIQRGNCP